MNLMTMMNARENNEPKFFGRRKGRVVRKAKSFLLENMLPQIRVFEASDFDTFSALPPLNSYPTLVLKLFRGEPAISKFVWNFTASHSSSPVIATNVRSALHGALPPLQPDHG